MILQCLASVLVGLECLLRYTPDVYIDTTGAAFSYPAATFLAGCQVIAYVHYPIISTVTELPIASTQNQNYLQASNTSTLTNLLNNTLLISGHVEQSQRSTTFI